MPLAMASVCLSLACPARAVQVQRICLGRLLPIRQRGGPVTRTSWVAPEAVPARQLQPSTRRSGTAFKYRLYTHTPAQTGCLQQSDADWAQATAHHIRGSLFPRQAIAITFTSLSLPYSWFSIVHRNR